MSEVFDCPNCGNGMTGVRCATCGLRTDVSSYPALWHTTNQINELTARRRAILPQVMAESAASPATSLPPPNAAWAPPLTRQPARHRVDWTAQNLLLAVGAFCLVVAITVFLAVTWKRLGVVAQGAILAVITAAVLALSVVLYRRRLTATAEALGVVAVGVALVDVRAWQLTAPLGSAAATAAIGIGAATVITGVIGGRVGHRSLRWSAVIGAWAALVSALITNRSPAWATAAAFSIASVVAAVVITEADRRNWTRWGRQLAKALIAVALGVAGIAAAVAVLANRSWPRSVVSLLLLTAAVAALTWRWAKRSDLANLGAVGATVGGAVTILHAFSFWLASSHVVLLAAVMAPVMLGAALTFGRDKRAALALAAGGVAAWAAYPLGPRFSDALRVPLFDRGWWDWAASTSTFDIAGVEARSVASGRLALHAILVVAFLAVAWARWSARPAAPFALAGLVVFLTASTIAPMPVWVLVAGLLVAGGGWLLVWPRRPQRWLAAAALPVLVVALGWSVANSWLSVAAVVAVSLLAMAYAMQLAAGTGRPEERWAALVVGGGAAITAAGLAASAGDLPTPSVALAVAIAAAVVAFIEFVPSDRLSTGWPVGALESAGLVGIVSALFIAAADWSEASSTAVLLVGAVAFAVHSIRPRRVGLVIPAAACVIAVIFIRLDRADVGLIEAYWLPSAAIIAAACWRLFGRDRPLKSWPLMGPGLIAALVPSALVSIRDVELWRPIGVVVAGALLVIVGVKRHWQAPLALGSVVTVIVGIDQLWPVASQLPRWLLFAVVGAVLLFIGATFERRARDFKTLSDRLSDFN